MFGAGGFGDKKQRADKCLVARTHILLFYILLFFADSLFLLFSVLNSSCEFDGLIINSQYLTLQGVDSDEQAARVVRLFLPREAYSFDFFW